MGHDSCVVVNCTNTGRNSKCKFYTFPTTSWKLDQRLKWIAAIKRVNPDGTPWSPRLRDCICSAHFIGGKKSDEMASPSYVPQIFPSVYGSKKYNETAMLKRHERFKARVLKKNRAINLIPTNLESQEITEVKSQDSKVGEHHKPDLPKCQAINLISQTPSPEMTLVTSQRSMEDECSKAHLLKTNTAIHISKSQSKKPTEVKSQNTKVDKRFNAQFMKKNTVIHIISNTDTQEMFEAKSLYSKLDKCFKAQLLKKNTAIRSNTESQKMTEVKSAPHTKVHQGCQVDMLSELENNQMTFTSNRYIYSKFCHAEIQTEIPKNPSMGPSICKKEDTDHSTTVKTTGYILGF